MGQNIYVQRELLEDLRKAIQRQCRCRSLHFRTVPVSVERKGKVIWSGNVEEFNLISHAEAKKGYAWIETKNGAESFVIFLGIPPVDSPRKAVEAHLDD